MDLLLHGQPIGSLEHLPEAIQERVADAVDRASKLAALANPVRVADMYRLLAVASTTPSRAKQVIWVQRAAQALADAHAPQAACSTGCSHCCHIPVKVFEAEAVQIGRAIGRRPNALPAQLDELHIEGYESPCPFLQDHRCSIYAHRPAICRSHLNLDLDDLLCQLQPGMGVPVPYVDTRDIQFALVMGAGRHERVADLRQWFGPPPADDPDRDNPCAPHPPHPGEHRDV